MSWEKKVDKAIWRGTTVFNPDWSPRLRHLLVEVAKGKEWADVEGSGQGLNNTMKGEDFCKYAYIIYAEVGHLHFHCYALNLLYVRVFLSLAHSHRANHILGDCPITKLALQSFSHHLLHTYYIQPTSSVQSSLLTSYCPPHKHLLAGAVLALSHILFPTQDSLGPSPTLPT